MLGFPQRESLAALGSILNAAPGVPEGRDNPPVFPAEVLVQEAIDDGIKAAVEISQEVASHEEPLWDPGSYCLRLDGHREADAVQRGPADGEDHKHHEHGQKALDVAGLQARLGLRLGPPAGLEHQHPDAQVTEGHDSDGEEEVNDHHRHRVPGAGRLNEGAGVDAQVVCQGPREKAGHQGPQ